ncbi:peroxisome proliferator-activated receptor gamma coactivator-related protein 1 [Heterodontus francisci]|uniref:peroxisome proliferator-activated receptor gamma coactivator-related protein 1 n=1 Tax=Heterodontus francisci TaxID=7792 RepID=UPI00355BDD83
MLTAQTPSGSRADLRGESSAEEMVNRGRGSRPGYLPTGSGTDLRGESPIEERINRGRGSWPGYLTSGSGTDLRGESPIKERINRGRRSRPDYLPTGSRAECSGPAGRITNRGDGKHRHSPGALECLKKTSVTSQESCKNKQLLDEESEATLLTALTEILDTVDDENPSPFDSIPDSEIFALPKGGRGCSLVGRQSCAVLPDSGKELFTHWVPAASKGPSTLWRLEKPKNRSFGEGISQQRSDGEEEDEDMINNGQGVSESGSELLDLHSGEQLNTPGLESGVTLLIGQNLPCGFNMKHVSLSDLVKYVHPYCLPMEAGTDSAGGVIELDVQVVQEGEVLDLEIPTVLCQGSECLPGGTVEIGTGLAAGKEPGPESQLQTLEQQEVLPAPPVQQESPPVLVRRRGRPRKTLKPTKTPVIGVQQDSTETPHSHSGLQTLLQTTENKKETPSEAQPLLAPRKQEGLAVALQESRLLAQQMEEVKLGARRIQTRGRTAAGRESRQRATVSKVAQGQRKPSPSETWSAQRGWSFPWVQERAVEPPETAVKQPTHPEQQSERISTQALCIDPDPDPDLVPPPRADPAAAPQADPNPAPAPRADPTPAPRTDSDPALAPQLPACDVPSPVVPANGSNEPRLRPISLQQYRLRLQQRQQQSALSAHANPRFSSDSSRKSAWPIVPIQSIVQGELSVLPLETAGHVVSGQAMGRDGQLSAPPARNLTPPARTLIPPTLPPATLAPPVRALLPPSLAPPVRALAPPVQALAPPVQALTPPTLAPPDRALTPPALTPPDRALTPPDRALTPPDRALTPPDRALTPPDRALTPPDRALTPPDRALAPPDRALAPPDRALAPPDRALAPPDRALAPPDRALAPPDRALAPPDRALAPPTLAPPVRALTPPSLAPPVRALLPPSLAPPIQALAPPVCALAPPVQALAPPSLAPPVLALPTLTPPAQTLTLALPARVLIPPSLAPPGCAIIREQPPEFQYKSKQEVVKPATLQWDLNPPAQTRIPALQPRQVQDTPALTLCMGAVLTPTTLAKLPAECPSSVPAVSAQAAAVRMRSTTLGEDVLSQQNNLLQAEAVKVSTVQTVLVKSPPALVPKSAPMQQLQSTEVALAQQEVDQGTLNSAKDNPKGIEAADVMSLLEQFEVTEATEEPPPGNSTGSEVSEECKLLDHIFGAELASTAGLTPPATPPHQIWKSVPPVGFLGKRKSQGVESIPGSPLRTVKLIEPKPLPQNNRTKCVASVSPQPPPETTLTALLGFGDHVYCLPRVSTQPLSHNICPPVVAQPDVGCRWNVKRQASITIKPITLLNHQCLSLTHRVLTAEEQQVSEPGRNGNTSDFQETPQEARASFNSLPTGIASVDPGRSCSQAAGTRNVGCDAALGLKGGCCATMSPCKNGETKEGKPFDSPHGCSRTLTSPCYRHQRYSSCSSSSSTSRSRSHSPAQKRRRYCRRRSRHSRHSSRSDSRSSSRSRSYSRSNSRSDSGSRSRSRSRSSRRCSIRMSYFTDAYDPYIEEPRNRYLRHEARARNSRRRELAIEERRVVYVGKIRTGMMREELRRRFEVFGEIEDCNIYFRNEGDNYGFVTYRYTCDAFAAIENGQTLRKPDELPFDLCFGGRRQFCKTNYADLDSSHTDFGSYSTKSKFDSLDFDTLLKQAKRSLRR